MSQERRYDPQDWVVSAEGVEAPAVSGGNEGATVIVSAEGEGVVEITALGGRSFDASTIAGVGLSAMAKACTA